MALRLSEGEWDTYSEAHTLCGKSAENYFQSVDAEVLKQFPHSTASSRYLYTTLLVEERAKVFYPIYSKVLKDNQIENPVLSIIREEENHLHQILEHLKLESSEDFEEKLEALREYERKLFRHFLQDLRWSLISSAEKSQSKASQSRELAL